MRRQLIWAVVLVLASLGFASAQETTTGSITAEVIDAQGAPVRGANITVTSAQGAKTFVTDANGRFFAPYLTPGTYTVKVEATGLQPIEQKNILVRLGQRLTLSPLTLKVGDVKEVIEVVATAPGIDTNSTTVGGTLDSDALKHLPVGRQFTDTLYLVPGVSSSGGVGRANPSIAGGSGLENQYVVDGVNITNTGYGAVSSYSIVFGSLGSGVTTDFIKETQVKTAGFEAEYGQATGGVVNVVTQSGTNDFHGSIFSYFRPEALEGDYTPVKLTNPGVGTAGTQLSDFGVSLGGRLMRDKLFFFGTFNPQFQETTLLPDEGLPLRSLSEADRTRKRKIYSYAGKLTWQAGTNRFDLSVFGDPAKGDKGPQRSDSLSRVNRTGFSEIKYGGHNQVLRYDGMVSSNWLVEASAARAKNKIEETPEINDWRVRDRTVLPNVTSGGIGFYEVGNDGTNTQFQLKSTNIFEAGGNHQIRYGVLYEDINYDNVIQRTGPTFALHDGTRTTTGAQIDILPAPQLPTGRLYRVIRANTSNVRQTEQQYLSFFIQDTWQIGKKLVLRPGVRYEQQKLVGSDTPPLCKEGDTKPGAGDGPGAAIPCEITWDGNWGPRLGAVYDLAGNGKSKVFASWGRFYAKIPNDLAARALSADAGVQRADYYDGGLTQPIPNGVSAGSPAVLIHFQQAGTHAAVFDLDTKSTYTDELVGGFEFEAVKNVNLGVRYIYRSLPRVLEDYQPAPVVAFDLGCDGADSVEYFIGNIGPNLPKFTCVGVPTASFEDPVHTYHAVEITANKIFADDWQLLASYRWSKLAGNFEGFFRNDNGQSDPAITSLFDFPTNDPSYTQIGAPQFGYRGDIRFQGATLGSGQLPNDRTHQLKVYATRSWSDLNLGLGFNAGAGGPLTALAANPNYGNSGEIPETIRGGGLQTVDGFKKKSPADIAFDVHADYTVKMGKQRVVLLADAFNVFDSQRVTSYDNVTETVFASANPDVGKVNGYMTPRRVRLGARFEW